METRRALLRRGVLLGTLLAVDGLMTGCAATAPAATSPPNRVYKVVFLFTRLDEPVVQSNIAITKRTLTDRGHIEGQNITYDGRGADSQTQRFPALAAEIVAMKPDVVVCQNVLAVLALMKATSTIPIVFAAINADPLEAGVVKSLARPGGNVTGIGIATSVLWAKRLQLLKELAPKISRVAVIEDQAAVPHSVNTLKALAPGLGVEVVPIYIGSVTDLDAALQSAADSRANALIHLAGFVTGVAVNGPRIAEFATQRGWPTVGISAVNGGLLNYDGVLLAPWERAGAYVDQILRGAKPAEMPVEGPTGSTFVINTCTATKLGLVVPPTILSQVTTIVPCAL
jgi:putative ABC transport system substrate-binding protein